MIERGSDREGERELEGDREAERAIHCDSFFGVAALASTFIISQLKYDCSLSLTNGLS